MQQLHLVGLTTDSESLICSARKGAKSGSFALPLDERLLEVIAEAVQKRNADGVSLEVPEALQPSAPAAPRRQSHLSPREIQDRLRAGRSLEVIAAEAGVGEEWVARFAAPVEAERLQVVNRARGLIWERPRYGLSGEPLGMAVRWNLADRGVRLTNDEFDGAWSAFHLAGQAWMVTFTFVSRKRTQEAEWEVDLATADLLSRNRLATELGYVEPGRRRRSTASLQPMPSTSRARSEPTADDEPPASAANGRTRPPATAKRRAGRKSAATKKAAIPAKRPGGRTAASAKRAAGSSERASGRKVSAAKKAAGASTKRAAGRKAVPARKAAGSTAKRAPGRKASLAKKSAARGSSPAKRPPGRKAAAAAKKSAARSSSPAKRPPGRKAAAVNKVAGTSAKRAAGRKVAPAKKVAGATAKRATGRTAARKATASATKKRATKKTASAKKASTRRTTRSRGVPPVALAAAAVEPNELSRRRLQLATGTTPPSSRRSAPRPAAPQQGVRIAATRSGDAVRSAPPPAAAAATPAPAPPRPEPGLDVVDDEAMAEARRAERRRARAEARAIQEQQAAAARAESGDDDKVVTIRANRATPPTGDADVIVPADSPPLRPAQPASQPKKRRFGRNGR